MSITEARSRYRRPSEIEPILTGGEDEADDFSNISDEEMLAMANKVFSLGDDRKKQLDAVIDQQQNGDYTVPNAHKGQYSDFCDQANYKYLKEKYPWLHATSGGIGIDDREAETKHGTLEKFLATIPHEDWENFLTDVAGMEDYYCLDDDLASELEMEEQGRWMTEDGAPDLIKTMTKDRDDSYEAYLLSKVTPDMVWEWSRETDNYPESQGEGSVWMDMSRLGKEVENQDWFLDQLEDDVAGWLAIKRTCYDSVVSAPDTNLKAKRASDLFDQLLQEMGSLDEQIAVVYNKVDAAILWQMFLQAFPDERREDHDPYWYFWKSRYDAEGEWRVGYEAERSGDLAWVDGYKQALEHLMVVPWFHKLIANWFNRPPEGHPELKLEALETDLDPDDPEVFMRHGGGLREEVIYENDKIVVLYPRDIETLNYHLRRLGYTEVSPTDYRSMWHGNNKDVFIIVAKAGTDLLGRDEKHEIGVLVGDSDKLVGYTGTYHVDSLNRLLADPRYGRSIRRMLMRYYRDETAHNSRYAHILLQLGGPAELRRRAAMSDLDIGPHQVGIGLHYIAKHKYRLAAKAFGRPLKTIETKGVWLMYDSVEDLLPVFKNEKGAEIVFANEHQDWFSYYWEKGNRPKVEDVIEFLSPAAIAHIREVLVNRRVWFPDGGPDGEGEYVLLRKKLIDGYDDETILDWIEKPSDQDEEDGVFDDIREAIETTGIRLLEQASIDAVYTGYIEAAVNAIDGFKHRWGTHPTKATKYGPSDTFEVWVPWQSVKTWASDYRDNNGDPYEGSLEDLAVEMNRDVADPDPDNMEASWHDINKESAADLMDEIFELQAPELEPLPEDPNQIQLPLKEDDAAEEARAQALMKEYGVDQPDYDLAAAEKKADARGDTQHRKRVVAHNYLRKMRGESADLDSPEAMGDNLLSGVRVQFENQVKAILKDSTEAHQYTVRDLTIKLLPSQEHSEEDIDASDGRLYNRLGPHSILIVSYLPVPAPAWETTQYAFQKIYGAATNVYQDFFLTDAHLLNPVALEGNLPEDMVIAQFHLFHRERHLPAAPTDDTGDEVPF